MKKLAIICVLGVVLASSCKKDAANDTITTQTIHGQVYNLCTDSGLLNCTVFLQQNGSTIAQMNSGATGNFTFSNVQIHSSKDYSYELTIPSISGIGGGGGINGNNITIDKSKIGQTQVLYVEPSFNNWMLYFPAHSNITISDTFILTLQQNIYRTNVPNGTYQIVAGNSPTYPLNSSNFIGNVGPYWMGWWQATLNRTVNGTHIIKKDSFYLGWNVNVTDTIPW